MEAENDRVRETVGTRFIQEKSLVLYIWIPSNSADKHKKNLPEAWQ